MSRLLGLFQLEVIIGEVPDAMNRIINDDREKVYVDYISKYKSETGLEAMYRMDSSDYHTLRYVKWLERRLTEEIKWGHRLCTGDDCKSSGNDCPHNKE
jgi:hypothetical protein